MSDDPALQVLFVCTANICRSAYAELLTRHLLDGDPSVEVTSAGTHGFVDHPVDPPMAAELEARGVDPSGFRSRPLTMAMVAAADLVLTAEVRHRQFVLDERPDLFRRVLTLGQLARTLDGDGQRLGAEQAPGPAVVEALQGSFRPASPEDDVADPYGRGPAAASATAARIEELVRRVLPVLARGPQRA